MSVRVRFFARFREIFGTEIVVEPAAEATLATVIREIAVTKKEGQDAIFDERGAFREFVILMQNGCRIDTADAGKTPVNDGDEIAIFPPVAGG